MSNKHSVNSVPSLSDQLLLLTVVLVDTEMQTEKGPWSCMTDDNLVLE